MISVCDVSQKIMLDSEFVIQITFENQLARISNREVPLHILIRTRQPKSQILGLKAKILRCYVTVYLHSYC